MAYTTLLAIGTAAVAQPQSVKFTPRPVGGITLSGIPLLRGYESVEFTYTVISPANLARLYALYDPTSPSVNITYGHPNGTAITRSAIWMPFAPGGAAGGYYRDVTLQFTRLGTAQS